MITVVDFDQHTKADLSNISYKGHLLRHLPAADAFRFLSIRTALTESFDEERKYVLKSVKELEDLVKGHRYILD